MNSLQKYVGGSYKKSARSKILCDGRMGEEKEEVLGVKALIALFYSILCLTWLEVLELSD